MPIKLANPFKLKIIPGADLEMDPADAYKTAGALRTGMPPGAAPRPGRCARTGGSPGAGSASCRTGRARRTGRAVCCTSMTR